jgi:hypothetical protein
MGLFFLQLLLALTSAVILGSESRKIHDHILLSQIRDSPTWRAMSPYLYAPETGWLGYSPRNWVPFSSPLTTHTDNAEVFDPASPQDANKLLTGWCPCYTAPARIAYKTSFPTSRSIVERVFVAADNCLSNRYQTIAVFIGHYVTICKETIDVLRII